MVFTPMPLTQNEKRKLCNAFCIFRNRCITRLYDRVISTGVVLDCGARFGSGGDRSSARNGQGAAGSKYCIDCGGPPGSRSGPAIFHAEAGVDRNGGTDVGISGWRCAALDDGGVGLPPFEPVDFETVAAGALVWYLAAGLERDWRGRFSICLASF